MRNHVFWSICVNFRQQRFIAGCQSASENWQTWHLNVILCTTNVLFCWQPNTKFVSSHQQTDIQNESRWSDYNSGKLSVPTTWEYNFGKKKRNHKQKCMIHLIHDLWSNIHCTCSHLHNNFVTFCNKQQQSWRLPQLEKNKRIGVFWKKLNYLKFMHLCFTTPPCT